jgi:hypothetical protein
VPTSRPGRPLVVIALAIAVLVPASSARAQADPSSASRERLIGLLEDVPGAEAARYTARDDLGRSLDTLKLIATPPSGYVGVYHSYANGSFSVRVATSSDLVSWRYRRTLDTGASQPTIVRLSDGSYLVAYEKAANGRSSLRFRAYRTLANLTAGSHFREFNAPRTLSPRHEGTPSIASAQLTGTLSRSQISVGFHYYSGAKAVDRQGRGVLTNFSSWKTSYAPELNQAFTPEPGGNIGDRDHLTFEGYQFTLIEVQSVKSDWSSWRVYLYDHLARRMFPLQIRTHGGSVAFGNPTVTQVLTPNGRSALAVTLFLFGEGAAPNEAGPLIYYRPY